MAASQEKNLIFLISQPRAGSTLLQLILSGHSDIATTSEPWVALHPVYALRNSGVDGVYDSKLARYALLDFLKQSGVDESFYKRQVASFLLSFYKQATEYQKKKFFLDKTPRYYQIVQELIDLFPEAKFIILFRNPLAVLNSILKTWVKDDPSLLGNYNYDLIAAPQSLLDFAKHHPDQCFKVKYEELVARPETVLKDICRFLGILYFDNMLNYSNSRYSEWKFGDRVGVHKASRPTVESLENWKKDFILPQERLFAMSYLKSLGPNLIKEMGYNYDEIESSIEVPTDLKGLISWSTIMSDIEGFSKTKQVREMIHRILSDENFWNEDTSESDKSNENSEWREIIKYAAKRFKDAKIKSLMAEREALRNSLFWKVTAPARLIVKLFKK